MSEVAKLIVNGQEYEFPIIVGTENEVAINVKTLRVLKIPDPVKVKLLFWTEKKEFCVTEDTP